MTGEQSSIERYRGWVGGARYVWDELTEWWRLRRGIRKARPKRVYWDVQFTAQHIYHAHSSATDRHTRRQIETALHDLEQLADRMNIELRYTTDDLE